MSSDSLDHPPPPPSKGWGEAPDEQGTWDQDDADGLVGQYALVGVTYLASDGATVKSQSQYHGRIVSADRGYGIQIACEGKWKGHVLGLPPDLKTIEAAGPGNYVLRSTGETVENPDLVASWSVIAKSQS
jgi:hypothetical protein